MKTDNIITENKDAEFDAMMQSPWGASKHISTQEMHFQASVLVADIMSRCNVARQMPCHMDYIFFIPNDGDYGTFERLVSSEQQRIGTQESLELTNITLDLLHGSSSKEKQPDNLTRKNWGVDHHIDAQELIYKVGIVLADIRARCNLAWLAPCRLDGTLVVEPENGDWKTFDRFVDREVARILDQEADEIKSLALDAIYGAPTMKKRSSH